MTSRRLFIPAFLLFGAALFATACDAQISIGDGKSGSGDLVTQTYDLDDFEAIEVSGSFDAIIEVGEDYAVEVLVDDNLVDDLDIRVRNGELRVGLNNGASVRRGTFEATIQLPDLVALSVSGSTEVAVSGVDANELDLEVSGASDLSVAGQAKIVTLDASGSSNIDITLVGVSDAEVDLSGASSAEFDTVGSLTGDLSGASDLRVPESTNISVDTSGASSVSGGR